MICRAARQVQLGRTAGARPAPLTRPLVVDVQQAIGHETIEMVGGQRATDPHGVGRLLAPHPAAMVGDVLVPAAAVGSPRAAKAASGWSERSPSPMLPPSASKTNKY